MDTPVGSTSLAAVRELLLVGSGGLGREVVELVRAWERRGAGPGQLGFLDDDPARVGTAVAGVDVLGPVDLGAARPGARIVLCTARPSDPRSRARLAERLGLDDGRYATLVHPDASLAGSVTIGAGTVVLAGVVMTADVRVGRHVAIMPGTVLTHDDVIGDGATLASGVRLGGGVVVEDAAYLGAGALIREGRRVGAGAVVGMGAVVLDDVPAGETWVGNPARRLRGP